MLAPGFSAENILAEEDEVRCFHFEHDKDRSLDTAKLRLLRYAVFLCSESESVYTTKELF